MTLISGMTKAISVGTALVAITAISKNTASLGLSDATVQEGEQLLDTFLKHNSGDGDIVREDIKQWWWKVNLDDKIYPNYCKIKGIIKRIPIETSKYALPLGLAAGAWFGGPVAPICAAALVLLGARFVINEVMGIGTGKPLY